jgi:glycosyltransferase involved in cell wall biosynthesis
VIGIKAMGMLDTLVHGKTALLAKVARKIVINEVILGEESGFEDQHKVVFELPRTVDYRASVQDIADHLLTLMTDAQLRNQLGKAGRLRVVRHFDYRVVAKQFIDIVHNKLGIS